MSDLVERQAAIDALSEMHCKSDEDGYVWIIRSDAWWRIETLPSTQPDGWLEQNKDKILQAGMEGREIDFRIGGRLFAIREKAQ